MDYCRSNGSTVYTWCNQSPKHLGNTGTIRNKLFGYCECLPLKNKRYFRECFYLWNTVFSINLTRYAIIHFGCKSPLRHQQCFFYAALYISSVFGLQSCPNQNSFRLCVKNTTWAQNSCSFDIALPPGGGACILLLEQKISDVKLTYPRSIKAGQTFALDISILDNAGKNIKAILPVEVVMTARNGRKLPGSGFYAAIDGKLTVREIMATDLPSGDIKTTIRCLASGKEKYHFQNDGIMIHFSPPAWTEIKGNNRWNGDFTKIFLDIHAEEWYI